MKKETYTYYVMIWRYAKIQYSNNIRYCSHNLSYFDVKIAEKHTPSLVNSGWHSIRFFIRSGSFDSNRIDVVFVEIIFIKR
jgi:hypothetical protein